MCDHGPHGVTRVGAEAWTDRMKLLLPLLMVVLALPATGCSGLEPAVRPYERSLLEDPVMDPDRAPAAAAYMRRVHECGEGARGATGGPLASRSCH
jgi:hypothetical protein